MAADVLGAEPDSALLKMAERPGGSPFLLVELLSGLRDEGLVRVESGRAELIEWRLPDRVSQSMRLRLERMSDSAVVWPRLLPLWDEGSLLTMWQPC